MSRFYGSMKGSRGEATRCGTPSSGITAHVRGWHIGIRADVNAEGDTDIAQVYLTGGSSGNGTRLYLGSFQLMDGKLVRLDSSDI